MKSSRILKGLSLFISLFCFSQIDAQTLSLSSSSVKLSSSANTSSVDITSDSYWGVYNVPSWITLDTTWGNGNKTLNITVAENPFTNLRTDTLKVYWLNSNWEYYSETKLIASQSAATNGVSVSTITIGASAGSTATFTITSNMYWEISDLPNWLTVNKNWQQTGKTVTLTAALNPQCLVRTGSFNVKRLLADSTYLTTSVTVNQTASQYGISSEKVIIADTAGSTSKFWVNVSGSWTVSGLKSWLTANKSTSSGKDTITLTAQKNAMSYYKADTLTITVSGGKTYSVIVIQNPATAIFSISPNTLTISDSKTNAIKISVTANTNWGLLNLPSWLNVNQVIGYGDSTFTLTAQTNTESISRSDSLVAYWFDANNIYHQQKLLISQTAVGVVSFTSWENSQSKVYVYPNPVKDTFSISLPIDNIRTVSIFAIDGRLINIFSSGFESIDVSYLPKACYTVLIQTKDNRIISNKISKQ